MQEQEHGKQTKLEAADDRRTVRSLHLAESCSPRRKSELQLALGVLTDAPPTRPRQTKGHQPSAASDASRCVFPAYGSSCSYAIFGAERVCGNGVRRQEGQVEAVDWSRVPEFAASALLSPRRCRVCVGPPARRSPRAHLLFARPRDRDCIADIFVGRLSLLFAFGASCTSRPLGKLYTVQAQPASTFHLVRSPVDVPPSSPQSSGRETTECDVNPRQARFPVAVCRCSLLCE